MVVPDPPLSRKQDKDDLVLIASTHSPTPSQRFSQFKGSSSSLTSTGDSAIPDEDIVTNTETSHLSNLALFARNKTPSESVWTNIYSRYSKVRTGSQRSSNSCLRKYVRNKNLNFDVKYGIACAIPELYGEDTYSCQDSEYSYSDTPVSYSNHTISVGVNGFLSSSRYKTSNFPLISDGNGLQHQVGEGQGTLFYQSAYNTQDLPESGSVASGSSKKSSKNKNSKLKKEAFSASRTESVKPFFCLYGKIVHTDDCKCFKINLWKRCLLPGCHLDKVSNTDTFGNIYQNNLDEDVYDVDKHVSSLSEEITADTDIAVSQPKSFVESIHSGQSCTQKLEPVCEAAEETDNQLIQHGLETDWGIGEEITQQYNSAIADLRVFSPETALPLIPQTPNYSFREESQSPFVSESESLKVEHFRHTYDNVKNLPFESDTSAWFKGKVQQVTEPSPRSAWSEATASLTQSLYNVADFVQYTQTKNNLKSSERPAKNNDFESCLALFDNLLIDIDDQLERKVSHTSKNSVAEQRGLYPWAALKSQSTTAMASQGKKNKNQFVRKAAPASPVNNTGEGDGSRFIVTNVTNKGMRLAEVSVDCSSHGTSQKDRNVTNKIELTQGSQHEFSLEQHGIPPDAFFGDAHHIFGQSSTIGHISTPSVNIQYSEQSSFVPRIHSHHYSSPSTGSSMHSAYSDSTGKSGTPIHDETQSLVPPAKPPRTFMSDTMGQHSASSIHKEAQLGSAQMFSDAKQQQSSRLQRQGIQQFSNNFDDDGQGYLERHAADNPWTASDEDIQFKYLEEQARIQYEGPETWLNNGQTGNTNQSTHLQTQVGHDFPFHMNAQEQGQYPSGHLANKTHYSSREHKQSGLHKIPRVPNAGKMEQTSSSHQDNWMDEMQIGQNGGQMEQQQSWQQRGYHGDGQQERLGQMPGTEHGGAQIGLNDGIVGPMHPHAQLNEMQLNEQGFNENVQGVQNQQWSKAQDCNIPKDRRHGNDQSSDTFLRGEGVSDYTGKSTYISDREHAQEQFDQRMNNPWFREMVQNMKELVEREGLIVRDVFPDGNCLFTAVVDQLRVRGNFKYTPSTLRAASVDYLIKNSKQRDGTPLEHFLSNETWEHYLGRMSRDGEWGEHIILGAISEVLRCRINVLGGMSGKSFTVVQPQYMSDNEEKEREKERKETKGGETTSDSQTADKTISENPTADTAKSDKSPSKDETNSETSQSKTVSKPATPHACEQSKSLHTGSASLPKPTDAKVESTDTSQRKDQTAFRSKQNWDKENEELSQGEELFIGLLGEMHYVSLRKKDWEERLHEKLWARIQKREAQRKERSEEGSFSDDDMCLPEDSLGAILNEDNAVDPVNQVPLTHLNFLFWHLCSSPFIAPPKESGCRSQDEFSKVFYYDLGFSAFILGYWKEFIETLPNLDIKQGRIPFFQKKIRHCWCPCIFSYQPLMVFCSPLDTAIVEEDSLSNDEFNLQIYVSECNPGFVRLCPVNTSKWDCKLELVGGRPCLQHLDVHDKMKVKVINCWGALASGEYRCSCHIVFRCPWPKAAHEWVTRSRPTGTRWLYEGIKEIVVSGGCHLKPALFEKNTMDKSQWEFCFHLAEDYLVMHVVYDNHSRVYRIFKLLAKTHFKESIKRLRDIFRHIFYYACEQIEPNIFRYKPAICIIYMISRLIEQLQAGFIPHYFICKRNLLDYLSKNTIGRMLQRFIILRHNLNLYAGFVMEERKLLDTGMATIFETIAQSVIKFSNHKDLRVAKTELLPLFIQEVAALVQCKKYRDGIELFSFLYSELIDPDSGISKIVLLQGILAGLPVNDRWIFAFYWDHCFKNERLLHLVCRDSDTEPLETLLGPSITECLGKKMVVLKECTVESNVIDFMEKFVCILREHIRNSSAVVSVLEFFLSHFYDGLTHKYKFEDALQSPFQLAEQHCTCTYLKDKLQIAEVYGRMYHPNVNLQLAGLYISLYKADSLRGEYRFQPFVEQFEELCERVCNKACYKYLYYMWFDCGYGDKADLAFIKAESLPGDDISRGSWLFELALED